MTLIVCSNKTLYADDCVVVDEGHYTARLSRLTKVVRSSCNRVAIAYLGMIPEGETLQLINRLLVSCLVCFETKQDQPDIPEPLLTALTADGGTSFIMLTRKAAYCLNEKSGKPIKISATIDHAWGTGAKTYFLCRQAGMTNVQAYRKVHELVRTVSPNYTRVDSTSLKPIVATKT